MNHSVCAHVFFSHTEVPITSSARILTVCCKRFGIFLSGRCIANGVKSRIDVWEKYLNVTTILVLGLSLDICERLS